MAPTISFGDIRALDHVTGLNRFVFDLVCLIIV
uniref:Uncharacterized protein n=1 Tax=Solanum lycopersicum TaxID=4081 RepID=K4D0M2_SOLLC